MVHSEKVTPIRRFTTSWHRSQRDTLTGSRIEKRRMPRGPSNLVPDSRTDRGIRRRWRGRCPYPRPIGQSLENQDVALRYSKPIDTNQAAFGFEPGTTRRNHEAGTLTASRLVERHTARGSANSSSLGSRRGGGSRRRWGSWSPRRIMALGNKDAA